MSAGEVITGMPSPSRFFGGGAPGVSASPEEKELARIGREQWHEYKSRFVPLEDRYIDEVLSWGEDAERDKIVGEASVGTGRGIPTITPGGSGGTGGRFFADTRDAAMQGGLATAGASTDASLAAKNRHLVGVQRLIGVGRGIKDTATGGLSRTGALNQAASIRNARAGAIEQQSKMQGFGQALGMGLGAYQNYRSGAYNKWFNQSPTPASTTISGPRMVPISAGA